MIDDCATLLDRLIDSGETQTSISAATGVPQATISRILAGKHGDPLTSTTRKIQDYAERRLGRKPMRKRR